MRKATGFITAVGALLLAATLASAAPSPGQAIAPFSLPVYGQKDQKLDNAAIKGKDTVFVFFNTACAMCREEVRDILPLRDELKINVVFVNVDMNWQARLPVYVEQMNLQKDTILLDEEYTLGRAMGVQSTPAAVLVDKEGKFKGLKGGYAGKEDLRKFLSF